MTYGRQADLDWSVDRHNQAHGEVVARSKEKKFCTVNYEFLNHGLQEPAWK